MFCTKCGTKIEGMAVFCPNCGASMADAPNMPNQTVGQPNPQMGQPMMGQPNPQMGQPMMGQPTPQMDQPVMGQPRPQMDQPMMGQPNPQMGQPMMGQPMMGQPNPQMGQPMMGQPNPQMGQPMMGQPNPQMGQPMMGQPNPQMGQPMMGQPGPQMGQPMMGQPIPQAPVQPVMPIYQQPPVMPQAPISAGPTIRLGAPRNPVHTMIKVASIILGILIAASIIFSAYLKFFVDGADESAEGFMKALAKYDISGAMEYTTEETQQIYGASMGLVDSLGGALMDEFLGFSFNMSDMMALAPSLAGMMGYDLPTIKNIQIKSVNYYGGTTQEFQDEYNVNIIGLEKILASHAIVVVSGSFDGESFEFPIPMVKEGFSSWKVDLTGGEMDGLLGEMMGEMY